MAIRFRLWLGFGMVLAVLGAGSAISYRFNQSAGDAAEDLTRRNLPERLAAAEAQAEFHAARVADSEYRLSRTAESAARVDEEVARYALDRKDELGQAA